MQRVINNCHGVQGEYVLSGGGDLPANQELAQGQEGARSASPNLQFFVQVARVKPRPHRVGVVRPLDRGIIARSLGGSLAEYLRITIGTREQNANTLTILREIMEADSAN